MNGKLWMLIGIVGAGLAVATGAFGAHRLESHLSDLPPIEFAKRIENWKTGAMYQFYHALGIILIGIVTTLSKKPANWMLRLAPYLMLVGIILFSMMLYLFTLTQWRIGVIVPFGGTAFIAGWIAFAIGIWQTEILPIKE
jgi:uncharacterized membrane protein YgdD (TMEM256/DUF423 family)